MKAKIFFIITILVILIGYVGCSTDSTNTSPYEYSKCFTVIDNQTKEPVKGALLRVYYKKESPFGSGGAREGMTEADGSICFTIPSGAAGGGWQVFGNQYKPICKMSNLEGFPPEVIEMDFECYLQFEIKNEEPFSEADNINVTYKDILECGSNNFILLNGADIDTTIIRRADPQSPSIIEIESSGADPFNISYAKHVRSRDTTIVNILY